MTDPVTKLSRPLPVDPLAITLDVPMAERMLRLDWFQWRGHNGEGVQEVPPEYVLHRTHGVTLLDVRSADEMTGPLGYIHGAVHAPMEALESVVAGLPLDAIIVTVSGDGRRSAEAAWRLGLRGMGWVSSLRGGMKAWRAAGYGATRTEKLLRDVTPVSDDEVVTRASPHLSREEIADHVGDARNVRWMKFASVALHGELSCVDGRDGRGVVGSPGGDAGEFLLLLAAAEHIAGKTFTEEEVAALLRSYMDAFGRFYLHSDIPGNNSVIKAFRADPRLSEHLLHLDKAHEWRTFLARPPEALRASMLDHLREPSHLGCGHVRMSIQRGAEYGLRPALGTAFLHAFHTLRWGEAMEPTFVTLGGGHAEGAVVRVMLEDEPHAFTPVPLVAPSVAGAQMFVIHPQVTEALRRSTSRWFVQHGGLGLGVGDHERLFSAMQSLGGVQAGLTLASLAAGLPVYDLQFGRGSKVDVVAAGHIPS